jgi:CBS domain-containing protein
VNNLSSEYLEALLKIPVQKAMRKNPLAVSQNDSVSSLLIKMMRDNIGAAIVVEGSKPIGIITEKDILERVVLPEKNMHSTKAKDAMSEPIITIDLNSSMKNALELMKSHSIRRLAVKQGEKLSGLVTERRILDIISRY